MRSSATFVFLGLLAASNAFTNMRRQAFDLDDEDFLSPLAEHYLDVCFPFSDDGFAEFNAPCNANSIIHLQCIYGSDIAWQNEDGSVDNVTETSPTSQRTCFCGSQYFAKLQGCSDCAIAHGVGAIVPAVSSSALSSFSSSYCASSNTPTAALEEYMSTAFSSEFAALATQTATTFSDPLNNSTAVSLYYTASVTGSSAYVVTQAAAATGSGSTRASGSQAAATASTTTATGLAPAMTPCLEKIAYAGALGLVGAVAML